jgi:muconolactone delta-isomerase
VHVGEERLQQVLLAGEMVVERPGGPPGGGRDVGDLGIEVAALDELLARRVLQCRLGLGRLRPARAGLGLPLTERYTERYGEDDLAAALPAETEAVRSLYSEGSLRQIWLRDDAQGACFLLAADSLEDAEATVATLPMARQDLSEFRIIPLRPYRGFGPR